MKTYTIIAKVGNEKFVKYHVNDLLSFTKFLDISFPDWRWFNVYNKDKEGKELANYTNKNRPTSKQVLG